MRLLADENFHGAIVRALLREEPGLDIIRVQDSEVSEAADPDVLAFAARENRVLLTHDIHTMTRFANDRIMAGLPMPGIIEVSRNLGLGQAIEEIRIVALASEEDEFKDRILFIPLRLQRTEP